MFGGEPVSWFDGVFTSFLTGSGDQRLAQLPVHDGRHPRRACSRSRRTSTRRPRVDGATRWQQFWRITLPLLKPALVPAVILSVVWTFNMFNIIYLVSGGEPAGANEILITQAYKIAFEKYRYGYAAAYSMVIFLILLVYGVFQTRMTRATEAVNA